MKLILMAVAMLIIVGCSAKRNDTESDDLANIQLDMVGLQGKWRLASCRVDCESIYFESDSRYILSFSEPDNSFSMTTDCNRIGGRFSITNDTLRFKDVSATEMACDKMVVEESMLRLLNDKTAYAICSGDSILYTAPYIGNAIFIRLENAPEQ